MRDVRGSRNVVLRAACVAASLFSIPVAVLQAAPTQFTDATGSHLWSDPANWSAGLPDSDTPADFQKSYGTLTADLGGQTWTAAAVTIRPTLDSSISLSNGVVRTASLAQTYPNFSPPDVDLLPLGNRMSISGIDRVTLTPMQIGSSGEAAFDLYVNNSRIYGEFWHAGRTVIERPDDPVNNSNPPVTLGGTFHASRDIDVRRATLNIAQPGPWLAGTTINLDAGVVNGRFDVATLNVRGFSAFGDASVAQTADAPFSLVDHLVIAPDAMLTLYTQRTSDGAYMLRLADPGVAVGHVVTGTRTRDGGLIVYDYGSDGVASNDDIGLRPLRSTEQINVPTPDAHVALSGTTHSIAGGTSLVSRTLSMAANSALQIDGSLQLSDRAIHLQDQTTMSGTGELRLDGVLRVQGPRPVSSSAPVNAVIATPITGDGTLVVSRRLRLAGDNTFSGGTTAYDDLVLASAHALGSGPLHIANASVTVTVPNFELPRVVTVGDAEGLVTHAVSIASDSTGLLVHDLAGSAHRISVGATSAAPGGGLTRIDGEVSSGIMALYVYGRDTVFDGQARGAANLVLFGGSSDGHRLSGTGTVEGRLWFWNGVMNKTAAISPGPGTYDEHDVGTMYAGDLWISGGATFRVDLTALAGDQIAIERTLQLDATLDVNALEALVPLHTYTILDLLDVDAAPSSGIFRGLPEGAIITAATGDQLRLSYVGGDGNDVTLTVVPEPGATAVLAWGLCAGLRRRRWIASR